jgi:hypothetical protein
VYKLWSSSLCSLLHPPSTSSLLGPNVFLSICSQTPSIYHLHICTSLRVTKFHTHRSKHFPRLFILISSLRWGNMKQHIKLKVLKS